MVPESGRLSQRGETRNVTRGREGERFDSLLCVRRLAESSVVRNSRNKRVNPLVGAWFRGGGSLRALIGRWTRSMKRPYSVRFFSGYTSLTQNLESFSYQPAVLAHLFLLCRPRRRGKLVAADGDCIKVGASPNPCR
jgi:hypothetical protein